MAKSSPGRRIVGVTDQPDFDLESWPTPDVGALDRDARAAYLQRKSAVEMCVAGESGEAIKKQCGIGLKQAVRLIRERCNRTHPDGRVYGFRGLIKGQRLGQYTRKKPVKVDAFGRGGAGAMNSLLELDPDFHRKLDARILKGHKHGELSEVKRSRISLWRWFIDELRDRKYEIRGDWPFNTESLGYGALRRYSDKVLQSHPSIKASQSGGETAVRKLRAGDGVDRPLERVFQRVEMDAHKLDGRFCVLFPDNSDGWVARIVHRLWVTVIIEVYSRAVLGYHLSLGREVTKRDVLRAIKAALTKWVAAPVTYCDKPLVEGAGLPSILGDEFIGICWEETSVDGALAETCRSVQESLALVVGSNLIEPKNSFSARRSLDDRPFIESFFRTLGDRGLQRMSNTTGASPSAKLVKDPDAVAIASQFQYQYLEELLQSLICNYNATPHRSIGYKTPLQMLDFLAEHGRLPAKRADPSLVQGLLTHRKLCAVHGGAEEGRRPYVNFENARYGGAAIDDREDLIGKKVWIINHLEDDARVVRCTTTQGELIGILRAAPPWHRLPHSLTVRKYIASLQASKRISNLGNDAIHTFMTFVQAQPNKKLPIHPAYLELQRILTQQLEIFEGDRAADRALKTIANESGINAKENMTPPISSSKIIGKDHRTVAGGANNSGSKRQLPKKRLASNS